MELTGKLHAPAALLLESNTNLAVKRKFSRYFSCVTEDAGLVPCYAWLMFPDDPKNCRAFMFKGHGVISVNAKLYLPV
jgi:hypothetical protein